MFTTFAAFLAQGTDAMTSIWMRILQPEIIWVFIPVLGILAGSVISIVKRAHKHSERMAMIAAGMHPDYPPDEEMDSLQDGAVSRPDDYRRA